MLILKANLYYKIFKLLTKEKIDIKIYRNRNRNRNRNNYNTVLKEKNIFIEAL